MRARRMVLRCSRKDERGYPFWCSLSFLMSLLFFCTHDDTLTKTRTAHHTAHILLHDQAPLSCFGRWMVGGPTDKITRWLEALIIIDHTIVLLVAPGITFIAEDGRLGVVRPSRTTHKDTQKKQRKEKKKKTRQHPFVYINRYILSAHWPSLTLLRAFHSFLTHQALYTYNMLSHRLSDDHPRCPIR